MYPALSLKCKTIKFKTFRLKTIQSALQSALKCCSIHSSVSFCSSSLLAMRSHLLSALGYFFSSNWNDLAEIVYLSLQHKKRGPSRVLECYFEIFFFPEQRHVTSDSSSYWSKVFALLKWAWVLGILYRRFDSAISSSPSLSLVFFIDKESPTMSGTTPKRT